MGSWTPRGRRRGLPGGGGGGGRDGGKRGGKRTNICEEEEARRKGEGKGRGRELEEWLELYLSPGGGCTSLREAESEMRVVMLAEAMANIDEGWFGALG